MKCGRGWRGRRLSGPKAPAFEALEQRSLLSAAVAHTNLLSVSLRHTSIGGSSTAPRGAKTPTQVRQAYGLNGVTFGGVTGDGSGQTIAIIDAYDDPTALADVNAFSSAFGLAQFNGGAGTPTFKKVNENGGTSLPGTDPDGPADNSWEVEESLDIEWAHATAPGANIVLVEADSSFDDDLISSAVGWARNAPGVSVVSMSFGGSEDSRDAADYNRDFTTPAGHSGITFLASTGDDGSPGSFPAYSSNVIAVGGTSLNLTSSGGYSSESGWSGSGGGNSDYAAQPGYQKGVVTQSATQRTTPDVSMLADPNTGVALYDSYDFGASTPWLRGYEGGTSLATPLWAGVIAVADQGRVVGGLSTFDGATQTLPALYSAPQADFHDITSGNNGDYTAGPGYDLVTGRGTPVANTLLPYLANYGGGSSTAATASISGAAFNDTNANGVLDGKETRASGKTVFLDTNNNGTLDSGEKSVVTASNGAFSFSGLAAGTYHVRRVFPGGYTYSTPLVDLTLTAGQAVTGVTIGSRTTTSTTVSNASLGGYTFDDTNADGILDNGERKTSGKTVFLDTNNNGKLDTGEKSVKTETGVWSFTGLAAGTYHVRKVFPSGFTYSTPLIDLTLTAGQAAAGLTIGSKTG